MRGVTFRIQIPGREVEEVHLVRRQDRAIVGSSGDMCGELPAEDVFQEGVSLDGQACSLFFATLSTGEAARIFLNYLRKTRRKNWEVILVDVSEPDKPLLDGKGNELFERLALERRELDHALAWFSTLGGAFSALGDYQANCAVIAGKISHQQFKFALRLGDPNLQSRCRLYSALSLLQQKQFNAARQIVRNEYFFATTQYVRDVKLESMCHGIWAKWRYERRQARTVQRRKGKTISL